MNSLGDLQEKSTITLVHATCVLLEQAGILFYGPSGSGKSDLALRLIDEGALLVSDDYTALARSGDCLHASPPTELRGLLEVRGMGIVQVPCIDRATLRVTFDLRPSHQIERLPEPFSRNIAGVVLPCYCLDPTTASATAKVRLAVRIATAPIMATR